MPNKTHAMLTIRLEAPLHAAFRELAYQNRASMNDLVVQMIERAVRTNPVAVLVLEQKGSRREC